MRRLLVIMSILTVIVLTGCVNDGTNFVIRKDTTLKEMLANSEDGYKIYLITMDRRNNNYWKLIDEGCRQAVKELGGINYKWIAPDEHLAALQGECIDRAVDENVNAILVSAISLTELNENLKRADEAGVKIIYIDSAATHDAVATLMTGNETAGRVAGETMLQALQKRNIESGVIGVAAVSANTQNTMLRVKGFREVFEGTNFTVAPTVYMNNDVNIIKTDVKAHPEYVGYFATNQQSTFAVTEQIKASDSVPIVIGFDTADLTLSMIDKGIIYATIQQNPQKMGHDGIEIAVQALQGIYNDKNVIIDTGVSAVTKENLR
ncbi:MAG: substrate-binding domain-containing protein [Selenomonadaceae bacterium]|nr:substrate-binding domain-containing protein [Selenomonadaceae bacterium]